MKRFKILGLMAVIILNATPARSFNRTGNLTVDLYTIKLIKSCVSNPKTSSAKEQDEARLPSILLVQNYWNKISAMGPLNPEIHQKLNEKFIIDSIIIERENLNFGNDIFARDKDYYVEKIPISFERGIISDNDAYGFWPIFSKKLNKIVGYYKIEFMRIMNKWEIYSIGIYKISENVPVARPFCDVPGDIEQYQEMKAQRVARKAAKDAAKRAASMKQ